MEDKRLLKTIAENLFAVIWRKWLMIKKKAKIVFQPSGRRGEVETGINVIEASRRLGADIETLCGEKRICGKCKVRIEEGYFEKFGIESRLDNAGEWDDAEGKFISPRERELGYRLACCATVNGDMLIFVPEESRAGKQVVSKYARDIPIRWNPPVRCYHLRIEKPTLENPLGDLERVLAGLENDYGIHDLDIDYPVLRTLPDVLRQEDGEITVAVWMGREIIRIMPGEKEDYYGIALDIGTTTLAGYLCNLATMEVMETVSMMNPQCKYGEDVMSRITYHTNNVNGLERMSDDIINAINDLIARASEAMISRKNDKEGNIDPGESHSAAKECITRDDILDMTIVCNTAMHHIMLKLNPAYLGVSPFPPVNHKGLNIKARDLGITINESSYVYILPNEAGFVGADNVGVLIAEAPYKDDMMQLIIDIGTNGELVLGNREKLLSSSCATGPAFEGAQIAFGMRAAVGAIERITIDPDTHDVDYKVIGSDVWKSYAKPEDIQAKGICGSGILDVLAELYRAGVILKGGQFNPEQRSDRFRKNSHNGQSEFVIARAVETSIQRDIVITQNDIRQIQLAKGALYAGCKIMMKRMGIKDVDRVKIAGAFGTHVDSKKALIMGLFPDCPLENIVAIGNAAGDGARAALLDRGKREEAEWVARNVEYVELTLDKDFQKEFIDAMAIPHMHDRFPHLAGIIPEEILNRR